MDLFLLGGDVITMSIREIAGSYGIYPFMTRVAVGDRPVTAAVETVNSSEVSSEDDLRPYSLPRYGSDGSLSVAESPASSEVVRSRLSVFA